MASVTVAPFGGVVGLVNILLDENELDVASPHVRQAHRELTPARLLLVQAVIP
jgi:hypothetical protein